MYALTLLSFFTDYARRIGAFIYILSLCGDKYGLQNQNYVDMRFLNNILYTLRLVRILYETDNS